MHARRVLADCQTVLAMPEGAPDYASFRIAWISLLAMLRTVGVVLSVGSRREIEQERMVAWEPRKMPTWKIERWTEDAIKDVGMEELWHLPSRELAITVAAILDAAVAELLSRRLVDDSREVTEFLGADGDGRAPAGSFGARIQMAYLIGILPKDLMVCLRAVKGIRNLMAHRVKVSMLDPRVQKEMNVLRDHFRVWSKRDNILSVVEASAKDEKAATRVLILFCSVLQSHLGDYAFEHLDPMDLNQRGADEEEVLADAGVQGVGEPTKD